MITVSRQVHIHAPVQRVFALMADPAARSALSPLARPIRVEIEGGGPLRAGSVCHFRLQIDNRIVDYHTRVVELSPNRLIASVSDTAVPFETRLETGAEDGGTRLTQTEQFEPTDAMLSQAAPSTLTDRVQEKIYWMLPFLDPEYAARVRRERERRLERHLGERLERWLAAIKRHLEAADG